MLIFVEAEVRLGAGHRAALEELRYDPEEHRPHDASTWERSPSPYASKLRANEGAEAAAWLEHGEMTAFEDQHQSRLAQPRDAPFADQATLRDALVLAGVPALCKRPRPSKQQPSRPRAGSPVAPKCLAVGVGDRCLLGLDMADMSATIGPQNSRTTRLTTYEETKKVRRCSPGEVGAPFRREPSTAPRGRRLSTGSGERRNCPPTRQQATTHGWRVDVVDVDDSARHIACQGPRNRVSADVAYTKNRLDIRTSSNTEVALRDNALAFSRERQPPRSGACWVPANANGPVGRISIAPVARSTRPPCLGIASARGRHRGRLAKHDADRLGFCCSTQAATASGPRDVAA